MTTTYILDKIRRIAMWVTGGWGNCVCGYGYSCPEVDSFQRCLEFIEYDGQKYPVTIIGDDSGPILQQDYIEGGRVDEVVVPEGIKRIGKKAFSDIIFCDAQITLPDSLLEIGSEAFLQSGMKKIVIPKNVIRVGENAFPPDAEVVCLSSFLVRGENNNFISKKFQPTEAPIEYRITDPVRKEVSACRVLCECGGELFIPDTIDIDGEQYLVTGIDSHFGQYYDEEFEEFDSYIFKSVVFPSHVRKIGNDALCGGYSCRLPESLVYIGNSSIYHAHHPGSKALCLPKGLRFLGRGNLDRDIEVTTIVEWISV